MKPLSKYQSLGHYQWGDGCDGWNLVAADSLSVKQERMPPGTAEELHFHNASQQFFFILSGSAVFDINDKQVEVKAGEGLHIPAGEKHRISNHTTEGLEFLLCSQPSTLNDRINCEQP